MIIVVDTWEVKASLVITIIFLEHCVFLTDDALMEQFVQQLPEHLIICSSDVRMLDIPLGQGIVASVSDAT